MKGIFVHKFGDLSANCENKLCAHTDSLEFLCTLLQVVRHQNCIINQTRGIYIYIYIYIYMSNVYEFMSISHETSSCVSVWVHLKN
jgi:hypothetical protein